MDTETRELLIKEGYFGLRQLETGEIWGLKRFIFTTAIVRGINKYGYSSRYCYENLLDAQTAFDDWDGTGEPTGYIVRKP